MPWAVTRPAAGAAVAISFAALLGCGLVIGDLPDAVERASDAGFEAASGGVGGTTAGTAGSGAAGSAGAGAAAGSGASGGSAGNSTGGVAGSATGGASGSGGGAGSGGSAGSGGCLDPCDCDKDGAKVLGGSCNGGDCDDNDDRAKPGQAAYYSQASSNPDVGFDFNCSGTPERDPSLDKSLACVGVSLLNCNTAAVGYFDGVPACGQSGRWGTCVKGPIACQESVVDAARAMRCH